MNYEVTISLASNCCHEQSLLLARQCLERFLTDCRFTESLWTEPIVSHPSPSVPQYLNQLLRARTSLPAAALQCCLKALEQHLGRTASDRRRGLVRIDLDLLQHGGERYHLSDWERPYVQVLMNM